MKAKIKHTVIKDGNFYCEHCKGWYILNLPIGIPELGKKIEAFNALHGDCKEITNSEIFIPCGEGDNICNCKNECGYL